MTVYPYALDDDQSIIRIDDNLSELGGQAINQLREAVFAIQQVLGLSPDGSAGSVSNRFATAHNADGSIKSSALTSVGLVTLPITDNQVASTAGIKETKLALDHTTSDLYTLIIANKALLDSVAAFSAITGSNLLTHIGGGSSLADGTLARHVASHIDLNAVPSDSRDVSFTWTGLKDKDGNLRSATTVATGLLEINDALTGHENLTEDAHPATAVTVNTDDFTEIPATATTVQKALDAIDNSDRLQIGIHRATMHANGVPRTARTEQLNLDGYSDNIVSATPAKAFLVNPPATSPVDSNSQGDDLIQFLPTDNSNFKFDEQFSKVNVGDIVTINYGNGLEAQFIVESIRFLPGTEWFVRINGVNLFNTDGYTAYARIDRPAFNTNTRGVLAVAAANNDIDTTLLGSVIVGHPRGATALGIDFDPSQLDTAHYKLWLHLYPTGNPVDKIIQLPAIDVTGNAGTTPGQYTLSRIVASTNDSLRAAGYNYRFIAFEHEGNFGIMLADPIGGASFSIVSGVVSAASLTESTYTQNVIGDATDGQDALGLGANKAALASPAYNSAFATAEAAANLATLIITPLKNKNYIANGVRKDSFLSTFKANTDGYWPATISARVPVGVTTVEVSYTVDMDLCEAGLKAGKTIVVQPEVDFADSDYLDADYGRFIIKSVSFTAACGAAAATTVITVVNGIHGSGTPTGTTSEAGVPVRLHFGADSVGFNAVNIIDASAPGINYNRFHEIYITEDGHTFSHERARMPKQAATIELLGTSDNWTIRDVSSKLRGFKDDSSTNLNKYVRFFVLNYNDTTGEYDGYIGKRDTSSPFITNFGSVVRARKNVPAKFYDDTNIDFIELEFFDTTSSTGTPILPAPTTTARYVDIEVFPSLQEDEELFYIASVEVDNKNIDTVTDRREIGSVSEKNLTTSAIHFIEAGDRYLHGNGVIRGFDYQGVDPNNDNRMQFDGGLALVNGHISTVNAGFVSIPQIIPDGTSVPQTLDWAICVNDKNEFVAIPITTTKEQFFAQEPGGSVNYYVPSVTFAELVANRKDLVPIYIANVTINSLTVNSMSDARKYAANETSNIPLTWVPSTAIGDGGTQLVGHFKTFDAVKIWINSYGSVNNLVKIRGTFDIDTAMDLTTLSQPVVFEGDRATLNVTSSRCFLVDDNVTFRNIKFNYNPTGISYTAGDVVNAGNGCIYSSASLVQNIVVENCQFTTSVSGQVPPFINFNTTTAVSSWTRVRIENNIFSGSSSVSNAAFAITHNSTSGTTPSFASDVTIKNNNGNTTLGIYITSAPTGPGINCAGCTIEGNRCGVIGFITSGLDAFFEYAMPGLSIVNNTCQYIANLDLEGDFTSPPTITYATGNVSIIGNRCHWVHASSINNAGGTGSRGNVIIQRNHLSTNDSTFVTSNYGFNNNYAILVTGSTSNDVEASAIISDNIIDKINISGTTYYYERGISTQISAVISNNIIKGLITGGTSIGISSNSTLAAVTITGNQIYRGSSTIGSYIAGPGAASNDSGTVVTDNFFDSPTVDGSSTTVIATAPPTWIIEKNINQTATFNVRKSGSTVSGTGIGHFALDTTSNFTTDGALVAGGTTAKSKIFIDASNRYPVFRYSSTDAGTSITFAWYINLDTLLPKDVKIVSVQISVSTAVLFSTTGTFTPVLQSETDIQASSPASVDLTASLSGTVTITPGTPTNFRTTGTSSPILFMTFVGQDAAATRSANITEVVVTYRW